MNMLEEMEETEAGRPDYSQLDAINLAVGCGHFVQNHRIDVYIEFGKGSRSGRLRVSRFYWDLDSPLAVDFARELKWAEQEVAVKKEYFRRQGTRYILVKDAFDGEGAEAALAKLEKPAQPKARRNQKQPVTGPRRGHTQD